MNISLSAFAPKNLVSRDGFGSSVPRQPAHLYTQTESGAYLWDSSRVPRLRPFIFFKPPYAIVVLHCFFCLAWRPGMAIRHEEVLYLQPMKQLNNFIHMVESPYGLINSCKT